jgi:hypothetical protein
VLLFVEFLFSVLTLCPKKLKEVQIFLNACFQKVLYYLFFIQKCFPKPGVAGMQDGRMAPLDFHNIPSSCLPTGSSYIPWYTNVIHLAIVILQEANEDY